MEMSVGPSLSNWTLRPSSTELGPYSTEHGSSSIEHWGPAQLSKGPLKLNTDYTWFHTQIFVQNRYNKADFNSRKILRDRNLCVGRIGGGGRSNCLERLRELGN